MMPFNTKIPTTCYIAVDEDAFLLFYQIRYKGGRSYLLQKNQDLWP